MTEGLLNNQEKFRLIGNETMDSVLRAVAWIERAQDADQSGGVPAVFMPIRGWSEPYPETTGYIIPTFLALADILGRLEIKNRAIRMGEWLISIQDPDGAFQGGVWVRGKESKPSIFNSGQVLFGLLALWKITGEQRWKVAGLKCANWLLANQDPDGAWRKFAYRETFHVYKTRVAWAMALAGKHWNNEQLIIGALKNVENALGFQDSNGWFEHASFDIGTPPVLHTFAYTIQGLLETGIIFGRQDFIERAAICSRALARAQSVDGSLPGVVTSGFSGKGFRCLTGIAQQVIVWGRLNQIGNKQEPWLNYCDTALRYLRKVQVKKPGNLNDGGFAGSKPIWGSYMRFRYPNWAIKFYLDAVIANANLMGEEAWG